MPIRKTLAVALALTCASFLWADPRSPQHAGTPVEAGATRFKFAVISDIWGNRKPGDTILDEAVREINVLDPDFVICVGDLIRGQGAPMEEDALRKLITPMWETFDADIAKLKRPFYYVFGNHDASNPVQIKVLRERYGSPYYSFNHKGCRFIVLFTEYHDAQGKLAGIDSDAGQIAWLEKDLAASRDAAHTFVFFHKPWPGPRIMALFAGRATTVFAGHWHSATQFVKDGINYHVLSSTGAGTTPDLYGGSYYQYALVSVSGKDATTAMVRVGAVLPDDLLSQSRLDAVRSARAALRELRVEAPRGTKSLDQPFEVRVPNPLPGPAKGTCEWVIPPGSNWTVTPARADVLVQSGAEQVLAFRVACPTDPFATPPGLLPQLRMNVLGGRALQVHSPLVQGLDPLYDLTGTLTPDRWPWAAKVDALRRSLAMAEAPLAAGFKHRFEFEFKNPCDKPLTFECVMENPNLKWNVGPKEEFVWKGGGGESAAGAIFAEFTGTPEEIYPLPRLRVKATLEGERILDESIPLAVNAAGFFKGVARSVSLRALKDTPALDDAAWKDVPALGDLLRGDGSGEPSEPTTVRVGATPEGLWVAVACREPFRQLIRPRALKHDGNLWEDDSIEIFVDPTGGRKEYFQFIVNAAGATYEGKEKDAKWDGKWDAKIGWPGEGWSAEILIPWETLGGKPPAGTKMGFNLARNRVVGRKPGDPEDSMWSPTFGTAHNPERFGTLVVE